ncbi:ThuA domain-containing protein [Streptomyces thinghirensis]|nr:ThuA domain-containing protein [Streptomyces thinghirensis]
MQWKRPDQWMNWVENPSGDVHTVARVRESTYQPGASANGWDHLVGWCRDYDGGRSFYTGMGGTVSSYDETDFRTHSARRPHVDDTPGAGRLQGDHRRQLQGRAAHRAQPASARTTRSGEPHGLVTAPDGCVFSITWPRRGADPPQPVVTDWNDPDIGVQGRDPRLGPEDRQGHARR